MCVISWTSHGYENASYCSALTGRQPAMQSPTAVPRMPASASGVSTQRSGPKRSRSPAVARKTPPARPTSSPSTSTESSRSSSTWKQSLIASTTVSSPIENPPQLGQVRGERGRRVDERAVEEQRHVGGRLRLGGRNCPSHARLRLCLELFRLGIRERAQPPQICLEAPDALPLPFLLDSPEVDVGARV